MPQKTVENEDIEIVGVQTDEPKTVVHLGWKTQNLALRTTQDGLDAQMEHEPADRKSWIKVKMDITNGSADFKTIEKEVAELYKAIFIKK